MINFLIVIDTIISISLIIVILLQRSEGGVLGLGGSKMGGVFTSRGIGDTLSKATTILGIALFTVTIFLAIVISRTYNNKSGLRMEEKEIKTLNVKKIEEKKMKMEEDLKGIMKEVNKKTKK